MSELIVLHVKVKFPFSFDLHFNLFMLLVFLFYVFDVLCESL